MTAINNRSSFGALKKLKFMKPICYIYIIYNQHCAVHYFVLFIPFSCLCYRCYVVNIVEFKVK